MGGGVARGEGRGERGEGRGERGEMSNQDERTPEQLVRQVVAERLAPRVELDWAQRVDATRRVDAPVRVWV